MTGDLQYLVREYGLGENYKGGDAKQLSDCIVRFVKDGTAVMAANCVNFFASHLEAGKIGADMKEFLAAELEMSRESGSSSVGAGRA